MTGSGFATTIQAKWHFAQEEGVMHHEYQTETSGNSPAHEATLGARLRRLRMQRRISLVGFARQLGVSKPTVWKWERDEARPRQKSLEAAASILGVSERDLVFGGHMIDSRPHLEHRPHLEPRPHLENRPHVDPKPRRHLSEVVTACKEQIAQAAGTSAENILITIQV
jgi:transcriptional regulator with XRE-family HTH domain